MTRKNYIGERNCQKMGGKGGWNEKTKNGTFDQYVARTKRRGGLKKDLVPAYKTVGLKHEEPRRDKTNYAVRGRETKLEASKGRIYAVFWGKKKNAIKIPMGRRESKKE